MSNRQVEELAKLFLDVGKLTIASLVLGFFQAGLPSSLILAYGLLGLTFAGVFFTMGLKLFKEVK